MGLERLPGLREYSRVQASQGEHGLDEILDVVDRLAAYLLLGSAEYETAKPPPPVPNSLRHTFPCLGLRGFNFWIILFARSVLVQQLVVNISDLIDGMDLDIDWGERKIGFETLQEEGVRFAERRSQRLKSQGCDGGLSRQDMAKMWRDSASQEAKQRRIEPLKKGRYFTRWRRIKSLEDPRTKDRPV
ncbi:hypothetical protein N0V88_007007 [Collariella sp. IMI 366227]|nr:hypothetical protein N0V88_007007 [Collariella sp. IMI 366227]